MLIWSNHWCMSNEDIEFSSRMQTYPSRRKVMHCKINLLLMSVIILKFIGCVILLSLSLLSQLYAHKDATMVDFV